jgi:hypothetical protein
MTQALLDRAVKGVAVAAHNLNQFWISRCTSRRRVRKSSPRQFMKKLANQSG